MIFLHTWYNEQAETPFAIFSPERIYSYLIPSHLQCAIYIIYIIFGIKVGKIF